MEKEVLEERQFYERLAKNLTIYRIKAGLTDEELSLKIDMPKDFIYKLEHLELEEELDSWTAVLIAKALNISLTQLVSKDNFVNKIIFQEEEDIDG